MQALELKIPPLLLFFVVGAAMALPEITSGSLFTWSPFKAIGFILGVTAVGLIVASVRAFRRAATTVNPLKPEQARTIVDQGIFAVSRNPMYLAMCLGLFSEALLLGQVVTLPVPLLFALYLHRFQILPEERRLAEQFGQDYQAYLKRVRRWL